MSWKPWIGALVLAAVCALPARAGELRAGVGRADITPPVGTPLGGYGARKGEPSTGVHDPIQAKALVLDDGTTRLAILTTDLVGTDRKMVKRVAEAAQFPAEQLLVCASHTHSGPGAYGEGAFAFIALGEYRKSVFNHLAEGLTSALKQALGAMQPARLAIGESELSEFSRNRRRAKTTDPQLWLLRVDTADGKPLAALVNLNAHGTVLEEGNMQFSADWMGFTQAALERDVPGLTALYANGAEGDISPNIPKGGSTFEGARAHGEKGAVAALALYRTLKPSRTVKLAARSAPLDLPQTIQAALVGAGKQTTLQCFEINDSVLINVPGEAIAQLGLLLKAHARRQGYRAPVIMGLANDHLGYLLTKAEMKKGGYETQISFFGEGFGEKLTLAMAALIGGDVEPLRQALKEADTEPTAQ
jgi:neutral ceramidase